MLRINRSLSLLACFAISSFSLSQVTTSIQIGKPEKPVVGLPFTADLTVRTVQHLANGLPITRELKGQVCRSADGIERYEGTLAAISGGKPGSTQIVLLDRAKRTSTILNSTLKTAMIGHLPPDSTVSVSFLSLPQPRVQNQLVRPENLVTTDLGRKTQDMIELVGKRITGTIPAGKVGNDQALTVITEIWFAPQLKIAVRQSEQNPLTGERTAELTNIRFEEPDATLFEIPEDYTIKDRPAMPSGMPAMLKEGAAPPSFAPEHRTKQIEDALNNSDLDTKLNVTFALAYNGDHLADAQILGEQMVRAAEQETADVVAQGNLSKSFHQMLLLGRYWGTLGFVYFRQGQQQKAEAFTHAAWELNPNELMCSHLGRIYEAQLRPKDALAFYRMALNTKVTGAEQDLLLTRLAKLGEPNPQPLEIDVTLPLPLLNLSFEQGDIEPLVDILLAHDQPPTVTLLEGNAALAKPLTLAIQSTLANSLPDSGPEKVVRRARVSCTGSGQPTCSLHFIGSVDVMKSTASSTPPNASPALKPDKANTP